MERREGEGGWNGDREGKGGRNGEWRGRDDREGEGRRGPQVAWILAESGLWGLRGEVLREHAADRLLAGVWLWHVRRPAFGVVISPALAGTGKGTRGKRSRQWQWA